MKEADERAAGALSRGIRGPAWLNRVLLRVIGPASVGAGGSRPAAGADRPSDPGLPPRPTDR